MPIKVKKPHDLYFKELMNREIIELNGRDKRGSALYFLREKKRFNEIIGISPRRQDNWIMFRKKPFKIQVEWAKQTWFKEV